MEGFAKSDRKVGHFYSHDAVVDFLDRNGLEIMIRAHSYVPRGYRWNFGPDGRCLTVFSSSGYEGKGNLAAVAIVKEAVRDIKTEIMSPFTEEMLAKRRILIPTWAIAEQQLMKPPMYVPDVYNKLIL